MGIQIETVNFHSGAPAWLTTSCRYTGYRIRGRGFGIRPGTVTIDGQAAWVVKWSPDLIIIARPDPDPFGKSLPFPRRARIARYRRSANR